ncbi:MAG: GFA family protein [Ketobacter sp.]|nr:GFA family protein [Ketobacter sp.]
MAIDCGSNVQFDDQENIVAYASSDWAERGFCKQCGTHLFYRLKQTGQYIMPVGLLEGDINFDFDHQIFIDEKPAYYSFSNKTEDMTGAEVFAKFSPPTD